jgi:hypothetical protein
MLLGLQFLKALLSSTLGKGKAVNNIIGVFFLIFLIGEGGGADFVQNLGTSPFMNNRLIPLPENLSRRTQPSW